MSLHTYRDYTIIEIVELSSQKGKPY